MMHATAWAEGILAGFTSVVADLAVMAAIRNRSPERIRMTLAVFMIALGGKSAGLVYSSGVTTAARALIWIGVFSPRRMRKGVCSPDRITGFTLVEPFTSYM